MGEADRWFPLQQGSLKKRKPDVGIERYGPFKVPWALAELAYREYSRLYGNRQSLERLAERGGFGVHEFGNLLSGFFEHDKKYDGYGRLRP